MLRELPEGWESVTIKDIATIEKNVATPDDLKGSFQNFIGLENIERDSGRLVNFSEISGDELRSTKFKFTPDHILYGKLRPYLNKVFLPDFEGVCSTDILTIKPNSKRVVRKYLELVLKQTDFVDYATTRSIGANLPRISPSTVLDYSLALPPLPIQRQVVAVLEQAEAVKRQRREADALMGALLQSVFREMFGDPVTNERGWKTDSLENLCLKHFGGGTPSKSKPEYYIGDIPWVSPKDMKMDFIWDSIDHISEDAITNSATQKAPIGSLLMVIRSAILKRYLPVAVTKVEVTINQDMKAFVFNEKKTHPYFMLFFFKAYQKALLTKVRAVTADNIEFNLIKSADVIMPPLALQQQFARVVLEVERIRERQAASGKEIEGLCEGLMQRAFAGELAS